MSRSRAIRGVGTRPVHACETVPATRERPVVHVVLPPRCPGATPLADLRDAGYRVVSYGMSPKEVPECRARAAYPGCEHVLVERTQDAP